RRAGPRPGLPGRGPFVRGDQGGHRLGAGRPRGDGLRPRLSSGKAPRRGQGGGRARRPEAIGRDLVGAVESPGTAHVRGRRMDRKLILFELNEVPHRVVDQFCRWRPKSWLARALPRMKKFQTYAEDVAPLDPWITWPTLHRGVNDEKHGILNFGQDLREVNRQYPPVWELLAARGVKVGVCGSLHSYPMPEDLNSYAFYIPDTFAVGS